MNPVLGKTFEKMNKLLENPRLLSLGNKVAPYIERVGALGEKTKATIVQRAAASVRGIDFDPSSVRTPFKLGNPQTKAKITDEGLLGTVRHIKNFYQADGGATRSPLARLSNSVKMTMANPELQFATVNKKNVYQARMERGMRRLLVPASVASAGLAVGMSSGVKGLMGKSSGGTGKVSSQNVPIQNV